MQSPLPTPVSVARPASSRIPLVHIFCVRRSVLAVAAGLLVIGHSAVAATYNQQAVEAAIGEPFSGNPSPGSGQLYSLLTDVPPEQLPEVYSKLSGDAHGSFSSALILNDLSLTSTPVANLRRSMDDATDQPAVWIQAGGGRQRVKSDSNGAQIRNDHRDAMFGGDLPVIGGWRIGGAIGKSDNKLDNGSRDAHAQTDNERYSLYGGNDLKLATGSLRFFAGAGYSRHRLDSQRQIGELEERADGDYHLTTQQAFGEVALHLPLGKPAYIEPFFGLLLIEQNRDSFTERGELIAATVAEQTNRLTVSSLGGRGRQLFKLAGRDLLLNGSMTWRHLQGDVRPEVELKLADTDTFRVRGTRMPTDSYLLQLKADYSLTRNLILDLDYNGAFSSGSNAHSVSLNAHWKM